MEVVVDPAHGVLRRSPFTECRVDVTVDQTGHDRQPTCREHAVGRADGGPQADDEAVFDDEGRVTERGDVRVAVHQQPDVLHQQRGHLGPP